MTENQKASEIAAQHAHLFKLNLDKYLSIRNSHPYEMLNKYRVFMLKLGLLTEIWVTIDKLFKEKYDGQGRKTDANKNRGSIGDVERGI
jgi:hypothetical protein